MAAALAFGRSEARCDQADLVSCLKTKAIAALDRVSRVDAIPLAGSVSLIRDGASGRRDRSVAGRAIVTEDELRSKPDDQLDRMLYDGLVSALDGRALRIGLPELSPDQLRTTLEEGTNVLSFFPGIAVEWF